MMPRRKCDQEYGSAKSWEVSLPAGLPVQRPRPHSQKLMRPIRRSVTTKRTKISSVQPAVSHCLRVITILELYGCSKVSVTKVTEARHNEFAIIQAFIYGRDNNLVRWNMLSESGNAFRRSQEAKEPDFLGIRTAFQ